MCIDLLTRKDESKQPYTSEGCPTNEKGLKTGGMQQKFKS